jgi:hypothetical protein
METGEHKPACTKTGLREPACLWITATGLHRTGQRPEPAI